MNRKICPRCKTGKETYALDTKSVSCPYQMCIKGHKCPMFVPLPKGKESLVKRILRLF